MSVFAPSKILARIFFVSVILLLPPAHPRISFAQYVEQKRVNQWFLTQIPSYVDEKYQRPYATPIGDIFNNLIFNLFHDQGFISPDRMQDIVDSTFSGGRLAPPDYNFDGKRRNGLPHLAPLVLPEVMQIPKIPEKEKPRFNPFQPDPSLIPPHLQAPKERPTDATEFLQGKLPFAEDSPENYQSTDDGKLPVLIPPPAPVASIAQNAPAYQIYPALSVYPRQPILSTEQRLFSRGLEAYRSRNYSKARQTFSELAAIDPDSSHAQFGYGISLFYAGEYEAALQALGNGYRIAKQNGVPEPTVWDLNVDPGDFRYYHKKLTRYVNANPQNKTTGTLLFLLTHAGVAPSKNPAQ